MATTTKVREPTVHEMSFWLVRVGRLLIVAFVVSVLALVVGYAVLVLQDWEGIVRARKVVAFGALSPWFVILGILASYLWVFLKDCLDLNRDGVVNADDLRLVPYFVRGTKQPSLNGVDQRDLAAFIRSICGGMSWSQGAWRGRQLPSGRTVDNGYHKAMADVLAQAGFIVNRGWRRKGQLVETDPDVILRHLKLNAG